MQGANFLKGAIFLGIRPLGGNIPSNMAPPPFERGRISGGGNSCDTGTDRCDCYLAVDVYPIKELINTAEWAKIRMFRPLYHGI
jgi:hypothetical protein